MMSWEEACKLAVQYGQGQGGGCGEQSSFVIGCGETDGRNGMGRPAHQTHCGKVIETCEFHLLGDVSNDSGALLPSCDESRSSVQLLNNFTFGSMVNPLFK